MKFKVTMKDPDTLFDSIVDAVKKEVGAMTGIDAEEKGHVAEVRTRKYSDIAAKWFEYGEYVTIEIDTEAKTAVVCEVKK